MAVPDAWEQAAPMSTRKLSDEHREWLEDESGIDSDIIDGRGYYSPTKVHMAAFVAAGLVNERVLKADSWLAIPVYRPDSEKHGEIIRVFGGVLPQKYLWPTGTRNALDVHPDYASYLMDSDIPVVFAEGIKKADAILSAARRESISCVVVAVNGTYGWKARIDTGSSIASPDFLDIALHKRHVYTTPDSDFRTNNQVRKGWTDLLTYLSSKTGGRHVYACIVPPKGLEKQGADDFLVNGGTLEELLSLAMTSQYATTDAPIEEMPPLMVKTAFTLIEESVNGVPHLIEPLLPEQAILVLAGHSGTYKTWHGLKLCLDGALGMPWLDHPNLIHPEPFSTLYVNKEMGSIMLGQRLRAMARDERYSKHPDYEKIIQERIFFSDEAMLDLVEQNQRERLEAAILEFGVRLVLLDSFSMCWTGDENSSSEVGRFYSYLRSITERTGVAWALIHHLLKPSGIRKKESIAFAVRGSGQIMQQADAALVLSAYEESSRANDTWDLSVIHAKARTSKELPPFISRFSGNDGMFVSILYGGKISEQKASAVLGAKGSPSKLTSWMASEMIAMPVMGPTGVGIRGKQLLTLLHLAWPSEQSDPPSETTMQERLNEMVEASVLEVIDDSKKDGKLYRFAAKPDDDAALTLAANRADVLVDEEEEANES